MRVHDQGLSESGLLPLSGRVERVRYKLVASFTFDKRVSSEGVSIDQ